MSDSAEETIKVVAKDDGALAMAILVAAGVLVIVAAIYLLKNRSSSTAVHSWKQSSSFSPPPERAEFIAAKEKLDTSKVADLDELKKLLMKRAIKTIPILLSLQNEGSSIERLYKRGMLTDDMHFKVKELKAFVDKEFQDIQFEADDLVEGWGQHIWPQAMQFHQMIQKQAEAKNEDGVGDEVAKKQDSNAKDKAKKSVGAAGSSTSSSAGPVSSSSSAGAGRGAPTAAGGNSTGNSAGTGTAKKAPAPVISAAEAKAAKEAEAERMAKLLLEEEEREKSKSGGGAKKGGKK